MTVAVGPHEAYGNLHWYLPTYESRASAGSLTIAWLHDIGYVIFPQLTNLYMQVLPCVGHRAVVFRPDWADRFGYIGPLLENGDWYGTEPPTRALTDAELEDMIG